MHAKALPLSLVFRACNQVIRRLAANVEPEKGAMTGVVLFLFFFYPPTILCPAMNTTSLALDYRTLARG